MKVKQVLSKGGYQWWGIRRQWRRMNMAGIFCIHVGK
jgi:hypothetical protein